MSDALDLDISESSLVEIYLNDEVYILYFIGTKEWVAGNEDSEFVDSPEDEDSYVVLGIDTTNNFDSEIDLWGYKLTLETFEEIKKKITKLVDTL